jgi:hypothetical protein
MGKRNWCLKDSLAPLGLQAEEGNEFLCVDPEVKEGDHLTPTFRRHLVRIFPSKALAVCLKLSYTES